MKLLSERLEERATFEDARVLEQAKAMGFVPEVYSGSQTGALLREAADALRALEGDAVDAARYRWLRDEASKVKGMSPAVIYATEHFDVSSDECGGFEYGPDLDDAIDKARGVPLDAAGSAEGVS